MKLSATSSLCAALLVAAAATAAPVRSEDRPALVLDGDTFITFYDLPSRRFRAMRRAFIDRDEQLFQRDLAVSIQYLRLEMQRMDPRLSNAMQEVIDKLASFGDSPQLAATDLDALFGRAHWLLAQHFLQLAQLHLDDAASGTPSNYLIATAHHLERAALWSGADITPQLVTSLDELRAAATKLRRKPNARRYQRLIGRAAKVLKELAVAINRPVRVPLN